jgi:hypothetical protein
MAAKIASRIDGDLASGVPHPLPYHFMDVMHRSRKKGAGCESRLLREPGQQAASLDHPVRGGHYDPRYVL